MNDRYDTNQKFSWMHKFEDSPLFNKLPDNEIECLCCQHKCVIPPGKLGHCRVRGNLDGKPYSPIWGCYITSIDPIEKNPHYHFLPGSKVYSYGTVGCNFSCQFCQNPGLSMWDLDIEDIKCIHKTDFIDLDQYTPEEIVENAIKFGCKSITSTYNEPAVSTEFSYEVFKLAKSKGLYTIYVSNGFESIETLNYIGPYMDVINIDLKSFNTSFYKKICGADLNGVCKTIKRCIAMGIHTEITTLVIPGVNDSDEELRKCAEFIASIDENIVWHLSAYHDDYKFQNHGITPLETLEKGVKIGHDSGLKYVYIINVDNPDIKVTKCPNCGKILIERDWFSAKFHMKNGKCDCGEVIPGLFEDASNLYQKLTAVPAALFDSNMKQIELKTA